MGGDRPQVICLHGWNARDAWLASAMPTRYASAAWLACEISRCDLGSAMAHSRCRIDATHTQPGHGPMENTMSATKMLFGYNFGKLSIAIIPLSQAKAEKSDWQEIDIDTMDDDMRLAYDSYKDAYRDMKAAREAFEASMRDAAGIADHTAKPAAAPKRQSLADYLKAQANR